MTIKTTFLMPTYNAMPYLRYAVKSIQNQTLADFHAIIVNDGSTDGTFKFLESIKDSRFEVIHQENKGYINAMNHGLERVMTPYISRLDADDIALPTRIEKQVMFLDEHPQVAVVGSRSNYVFLSKGIFRIPLIFKTLKPSVLPPMSNPPFWDPVKDGHNLTHPSTTIRMSSFNAVGGYRDLAPAEDYDLWLRFHDAGFKLACLQEALCLYRIRASSVSSKSYLNASQIGRYAMFCHECRVSSVPEPSFEDYSNMYPLSHEMIETAERMLQLRNAMGDFLDGNFWRGGNKLATFIVRNRQQFISKVKSRCDRI